MKTKHGQPPWVVLSVQGMNPIQAGRQVRLILRAPSKAACQQRLPAVVRSTVLTCYYC